MTRLGKVEKAIEVVKEDIQDNRNVNTLVVGSMGTGKDFSVIIPNILLEEEKNLVVIDPLNQIADVYSFKEKQGYNILSYDLSKGNVLQQLKEDMEQPLDGKWLIHLSLSVGFFSNRDEWNVIGKRIFQFLEIVSEKNTLESEREKSFHVFLIESDSYLFTEPHYDILENWLQYDIGLTMSVQHLQGLDDTVLEGFDYILYKRVFDPKTVERIENGMKYHYVEFNSKLLGQDRLFLPLTRGMVTALPLNAGLLYEKDGSGVRIVETYNTEDILGRAMNCEI